MTPSELLMAAADSLREPAAAQRGPLIFDEVRPALEQILRNRAEVIRWATSWDQVADCGEYHLARALLGMLLSGLADYDYVEGEETVSVAVPEHSPETRRRAAGEVACAFAGVIDEAPRAFAALAESGIAETVAQHVTEPDGCGCEDTTWWCPLGDGERRTVWTFERSAIERLEQAAFTSDESEDRVPAGGSQ